MEGAGTRDSRMHAFIAAVIEVTRESNSTGMDGVERRRRDDERASIDLENNGSESCDMVNFGGATSGGWEMRK